MKRTQYLITGAAGNLGSSVARRLAAEGKRVRALVLKGDPAAERLPKDVEILVGDITDSNSLKHFFAADGEDESVVIHCASIVTVSPDYSEKVYEVNVRGTKNIVAGCIERKVKKLVYISSTGAIPERPRGEPIDEPSSFDPELVVGFYGQTKAEASQIVLNAVRDKGLDASLVFPSGICGPGDYALGPFTSFLIDYLTGKIGAGICGSFNAVDVRDLAAGVIACCDKGRKGEGYIMANACVSMRQLFHLLSCLSGTKEVKTIFPASLARVAALAAEAAAKLRGRPASRMTTYAVYNLARNNRFNSAKAAGELGYRARPFVDTIADSIDWLWLEGRIQGTHGSATPSPGKAS